MIRLSPSLRFQLFVCINSWGVGHQLQFYLGVFWMLSACQCCQDSGNESHPLFSAHLDGLICYRNIYVAEWSQTTIGKVSVCPFLYGTMIILWGSSTVITISNLTLRPRWYKWENPALWWGWFAWEATARRKKDVQLDWRELQPQLGTHTSSLIPWSSLTFDAVSVHNLSTYFLSLKSLPLALLPKWSVRSEESTIF